MRISTIGSALIKSPGCAAVFHTYGPYPRRARRSLMAVRNWVIWIDLIGVFGPSGGFSGSSSKVGGPLCGAEGARNVGGESETGLSLSRNSMLLLRASCSVGKSTLGSFG